MRFDVMKESAYAPLLEWNDSPVLPENPGMPSTDYASCSPDMLALFSQLGSRDAAGSESDIEQLVTNGLAHHFAHPPRKAASACEDLAQRFQDSHVPPGPMPARSYLRYLFEDVVPYSVRTDDPQFVGHMTSALPAFVRPLGRIMTAINQNVVKLE